MRTRTRPPLVALVIATAALVAILAVGSTPSRAAASYCEFTVWGVNADTLTVREFRGGSRVLAVLHRGDAVLGPIGQGGETWVYGLGVHRHGSWSSRPRGWVLHSYLNYEYTQCY
jgi:hypothetical protein